MGEKRKLPARDRGGSAAKKRISETSQRRPGGATPARKEASTPVQASLPEPAEVNLPTKVKDGQPLPTVPKPQLFGPTSQDYQSYMESGVIAAALHRSRTKWLQDSIFEKYWVKPSKKKSQAQPAFQNPPRESMVKLGPCSIVIEPHHFDAILYTVRDPRSNPPPASQAQRPIVQYTLPTNPDNFHQFQPRPPANQSRIQSQYPAPDASSRSQTPTQPQPQSQSQSQPQPQQQPPPQAQPQAHHQAPPQPQPPQRHEQPNHSTTPNPGPPPPPTAPRGEGQTPTPIAAAPPTPGPPDPASQAGKPSPDPVIQMLATRAASNPELKALMRVVASSKASQEQLRSFQAHIDELNAILASRQKDQPNSSFASSALSTAPTSQANGISSPGPGTPTPGPPPPQNAPPAAHHAPALYPRPSQPSVPPIRSKNPQQSPASQTQYFQQQHPPPPPPRQDIKGVVLEFVPPAGSTAAAHGASGDRYLFPVNTILDYFPGHTTVIASFLVTKEFDPSAPPPESTVNQTTGKGKTKKPKGTSTPVTATPNGTPSQTPAPQTDSQPTKPEKSSPTTDSKPKNSNVKEYYQPVTMRLHASSSKILDPLSRIVKSPADVRQHMNDVMDRMERADIEYLAMRLPRERSGRGGPEEQGPGEDGSSVRGSKNHNINASSGVNGKSKAKDAEQDTVVKREGADGEDVEEELLEFYDVPSSLVPLRCGATANSK